MTTKRRTALMRSQSMLCKAYGDHLRERLRALRRATETVVVVRGAIGDLYVTRAKPLENR